LRKQPGLYYLALSELLACKYKEWKY